MHLHSSLWWSAQICSGQSWQIHHQMIKTFAKLIKFLKAMWTLKTDIHFEAASAGGDADCCSDILFGWSSISTVFDPSGGVTNEQKKQKYHMTVSANAAISLMGFDPFWTSENFHATCDTCLEWKKLVNEREEERESPSHVSHLACLVPKCHFPLRNCILHYLPKIHCPWHVNYYCFKNYHCGDMRKGP